MEKAAETLAMENGFWMGDDQNLRKRAMNPGRFEQWLFVWRHGSSCPLEAEHAASALCAALDDATQHKQTWPETPRLRFESIMDYEMHIESIRMEA